MIKSDGIDKAIQMFREKHPKNALNYIFLREANIDRYFDVLRVEVASHNVIMKLLRDQFPNNESIVEFSNRVNSGQHEKLLDVRKDIAKLKAAATGGGYLCEFEHDKAGEREWGFLVLKNGNIVERQVLANDTPVKAEEGLLDK